MPSRCPLGRRDRSTTLDYLALLAHVHATAGDREKALQLLEQLMEFERNGSIWHYGLALAHLALGERELALKRLELSCREKETGRVSNISRIKVDPALDPLRDDPGFEVLANKVVPATA